MIATASSIKSSGRPKTSTPEIMLFEAADQSEANTKGIRSGLKRPITSTIAPIASFFRWPGLSLVCGCGSLNLFLYRLFLFIDQPPCCSMCFSNSCEGLPVSSKLNFCSYSRMAFSVAGCIFPLISPGSKPRRTNDF